VWSAALHGRGTDCSARRTATRRRRDWTRRLSSARGRAGGRPWVVCRGTNTLNGGVRGVGRVIRAFLANPGRDVRLGRWSEHLARSWSWCELGNRGKECTNKPRRNRRSMSAVRGADSTRTSSILPTLTRTGTGRPAYSITSSARPSSESGTVRPSALAVLTLITRSYLVDACTGRSAGFSPLKMRCT
jgi:hypothetical protein